MPKSRSTSLAEGNHLPFSKLRLVALAAALLAVAAPSAARAAAVGINIPGGASAGSLVPTAAATGASTARVFLTYPGGSALDGGNLAAYDAIVDGLVSRGVRPVIVVSGHTPPSDVNAFATFVGSLAARWAGKVAAWELWNEEDEAIWWGTAGGDPTVYAQMLRAAYPKVHPYAPMFMGALTGNNYDFLEKVYAALGGSSSGAFDGVAAHTDTACSLVAPDVFARDPNGRINRYSFLGVRELHETMLGHGDGNKPIWLTELGWSTDTGICQSGMYAGQKAAGVDEATQARYLAMAWHCLRDYPYVTNAMWFTLIDGPASDEGMYGLLRGDGSQKPSYSAFQTVVAGGDPFAGQQCGDFTPPTIAVTAPRDGERFSGALPIDVSASDASGVGRITLLADGVKIRNFTPTSTRATGALPTTLHGALDWQGAKKLSRGAHVIRVVALDANGNSSSRDIRVTKTSGGSGGGGSPPPPSGPFVPRGVGNVGAVTGRVCVTRPGSTQCVPLGPGDTIPVGSIVDARFGSITFSVSDGHGGSYTGTFSGGIFLFTQHTGTASLRAVAAAKRRKAPKFLISDLTLVQGDFSVCPGGAKKRSADASRRRVVRYLQAKAHGKFNVIGKHASGIERGTSWQTTDTCDATEIKVTQGAVVVTDFAKHRKVVVKAGRTYRATGAKK